MKAPAKKLLTHVFSALHHIEWRPPIKKETDNEKFKGHSNT